MNAKAAIFKGAKNPFEIREYAVTPPDEGMAELKLTASGICGTDVHFYNGKLPLEPPKVLGHEFVGKIEKISDADSKKYNLAVGDSVISDIAVPCGKCKLCKNGDDANCVNMGVTNGGNPDVKPHFYGGFAEASYAPAANLVKIPKDVDTLAACVFACPGPTVIHAFNLAKRASCGIENAGTVVVIGTGPVEIDPHLITFKALCIIGSSQYSMKDVKEYLEFLESDRKLQEKIKALATCYKVEDINAAFSDIRMHKNIKTVLVRGKDD